VSSPYLTKAMSTNEDGRRLATIGVYGFAAQTFIATLRGARVVLVLDVRQRRGVRGTQYAWANSLRLQAGLRGAGIAYRHVRELAPTTELRQLQYREDAKLGIGKRNRNELAPEYIRRFNGEILDHVDLERLACSLPTVGCTALMCVERDPAACHRSLIAARLARFVGGNVLNLLPAG
jgi:uncharacterized protein (DUF488 family)